MREQTRPLTQAPRRSDKNGPSSHRVFNPPTFPFNVVHQHRLSCPIYMPRYSSASCNALQPTTMPTYASPARRAAALAQPLPDTSELTR
ncbi:unnamed protein product [Lasius platythorax]|uniref:Uncharacterized protein n=1 Tax=Lasius platythorax TaxID=488582 RepID=A0AAV2P529_9HYME